jgi:hypothetical protein
MHQSESKLCQIVRSHFEGVSPRAHREFWCLFNVSLVHSKGRYCQESLSFNLFYFRWRAGVTLLRDLDQLLQISQIGHRQYFANYSFSSTSRLDCRQMELHKIKASFISCCSLGTQKKRGSLV